LIVVNNEACVGPAKIPEPIIVIELAPFVESPDMGLQPCTPGKIIWHLDFEDTVYFEQVQTVRRGSDKIGNVYKHIIGDHFLECVESESDFPDTFGIEDRRDIIRQRLT